MNLKGLPVYQFDEVTHEYHDNWWDGPLSGVISDDGERYYYNTMNMGFKNINNTNISLRIFGIYELTKEEWEYQDERHSAWLKHVDSGYNDNFREIYPHDVGIVYRVPVAIMYELGGYPHDSHDD